MELHDRMMVGIRAERLELDELVELRRQEAKERQAPRDQRQGRSVHFHRHGRNAKGHH